MLTIEQAELAQYMSQLSECYFQANWHMGLEYALWGGILAEQSQGPYMKLETAERGRLAVLALRCKGWLVWDEGMDDKEWVPHSLWSARYYEHLILSAFD